MDTGLSPIESEFASKEQEKAYERWLPEKVEASLVKTDDPTTPRYRTDQVMRRMHNIVEAAQTRHAAIIVIVLRALLPLHPMPAKD